MTRAFVRGAALLVTAALALHAQAPATDAERSAQQRIEALVRDFDRRGLPAELLQAKVAEGVAKGATQARIADAVTVLATRIDSIARLLAPAVTVPELQAGAEALAVGVPGLELRALRTAAGRRPVDPYYLLVVRLIRRGVTQARAVRAVRTLIDRAVPSNTLLALADDLAHDVASGTAPDAALSDRMTRLIGGLGPVNATTGDFTGVQSNGSSGRRP